ncbi:MAG: hypothetical protein LCI00_16940 [Chloroflexi bacterium]|nr:hypothetical protein [Chloroflexota bacterium]
MVQKTGEVLQPLSINVESFKKRFKALSSLSTYERANKVATERKRAAWAAYRPFERAQLYDSLDELTATILSPFANYSSKRSTKGGVLYAQASVVLRPTEQLAIAHALGLYKFDSEDPVYRQDPGRILHWCISCQHFKSPDQFPKVKYSVDGLAYACKSCRDKEQRTVWKAA